MQRITLDQSNHPTSVRAYNKNCMGCESEHKDIMISIGLNGLEILDFFLNQEDATRFHKELGERIKQNLESLQ